jgi:flagellar basal-body rod modification protein FlgD
MTTPIGTLPPTAAAAAALNSTTDKTAADNGLGKDAFLKLLVAQLKYQNPMNPTDSTQFIAQTAQFTMVEKLTQLAETVAQNAAIERLSGAANLIGRKVTYLDSDGKSQTGVVTGTQANNGDPSLEVGDAKVGLGSVLSVEAS